MRTIRQRRKRVSAVVVIRPPAARYAGSQRKSPVKSPSTKPIW